jgi:EAL and modified HD-GYP domain-containing signal transduction protein
MATQAQLKQPVSSSLPENAIKLGAGEKIFVARQPIFDAAENVIGYQLLFRESSSESDKNSESFVRITEHGRLISNAINQFGLGPLLESKIAFIPISADALSVDFLDLLPHDKVVLDVYPIPGSMAELTVLCGSLREKGFKLCLNGFDYDAETKELFEMASYIGHDVVALSLDHIADQLTKLSSLPLKHIARNLPDYRTFHGVRAYDFALYQGNCLEGADTAAMNRVDPSTMRVMRLFNLVATSADLSVVEENFKHDVALCYSLLCYINSAGFGMPYKVDSIRSAVMLLGYDFLLRWLGLLIFAGVDIHAGQRLMLNTALIRARFTELLGKRSLSQREGDQLFIVGLFSLLDVLLGIPLEKALGNLNLRDEMVHALLRHEGRFAPFLELAMAFEENDLPRARLLAKQLDIDISDATADHFAAMEWAAKLG